MEHHVKHSTLKGYTFAFIASVVLTLTAYIIVDKKLLDTTALVTAICGLAMVQAAVQLWYFLYLGKEKKPRTNLLIFLFMALILLILIIGTFWIMYSLNERLMPPMQM